MQSGNTRTLRKKEPAHKLIDEETWRTIPRTEQLLQLDH